MPQVAKAAPAWQTESLQPDRLTARLAGNTVNLTSPDVTEEPRDLYGRQVSKLTASLIKSQCFDNFMVCMQSILYTIWLRLS